MRRHIEGLRRKAGSIPSYFAVVLVLLIIASIIFAMVASLDMVTVKDHGSGASHTLLTASNQPEEIVKMAGLECGDYDQVTYNESEAAGPEVTILRAFPVQVKADGDVYEGQFVGGTVGDLIEESGVVLEGEDFVEPAADTPLSYGISAQVHRVTYNEETAREEVPEAEVAAYMESLPEGTEFEPSNTGEYEVTVRNRLIDGAVTSSEVLEMVPIHEPIETRPEDSYDFQPGVPCSRIEGYDDIEVGADGIPLNYERLWEGAVATAYSASRGRGSSGLGLYCGTAAVNPNVIPYGTRMYITSADGSFVYGYCIATDTGTAMMEGYVDIDLFFETNAECLRFGKRAMNIYILPNPPAEETAE